MASSTTQKAPALLHGPGASLDEGRGQPRRICPVLLKPAELGHVLGASGPTWGHGPGMAPRRSRALILRGPRARPPFQLGPPWPFPRPMRRPAVFERLVPRWRRDMERHVRHEQGALHAPAGRAGVVDHLVYGPRTGCPRGRGTDHGQGISDQGRGSMPAWSAIQAGRVVRRPVMQQIFSSFFHGPDVGAR